MSFEPSRLSFTIWRGSTFQKSITYFEDELETVRHDLTGYDADFVIRSRPGGHTLFSMDVATGIVLRESLGIITITIPALTTADFDWTGGSYGLTVTAPDGTVEPLLHGAIRVRDL